MPYNLSRLNKVDLREVWNHEALDFTKWLSQSENLDLLSEEIGVGIKLVQTEASVGRFNVDILAEEEGTGKKIIIENQLEDTNHDHLGKIITYASGYDAEIIVWIVKDVKDEHQKAVEWLNEHTDENINFFLIKLELWRIENSNAAPKFDVLVSPNEWAKAIKAVPVANGELTETKLQQLDFWTKFKNYAKAKDGQIRLRSPRPQHWFDISMGFSGAHVGLTINTRENAMGCELWIDNDKDLFHYLQEHKAEIEKEIKETANWVDAPVASRVVIKKSVNDIFSEKEMNDYFSWLYEKTVLFQQVFGKYIREFKKQS